MTNELSTIKDMTIGEIANQVAARSAFANYRSRKAINTIVRQDNDLEAFSDYLWLKGIEISLITGNRIPEPKNNLATNPMAWKGITWGLIQGFIDNQLEQGFAIPSINIRLSTIKTYAKLAVKSGALDRQEYAMIALVPGYSHKEVMHIDEKRKAADMPTRIERPGAKKAQWINIDPAQAKILKLNHDNTPQGRRDRLLMCLLLDHGLRCGEVARLNISNFNLKTREFRFYRPKISKIQTHRMTADTLQAVRAYLTRDALAIGALLRGSRKGRDGNNLTKAGMSERAITKRVKVLGEAAGIEGLSAHDCRHYWTTQAVRNGTPIDRLMDAGGWKTPAMVLRYIEAAKIANEGVILE